MEEKSLSQKINDYRVFPRLFALFYLYWMSRVLVWSMGLPDPATAEYIVMAVIAGAAAYFKFYVESGPNGKK